MIIKSWVGLLNTAVIGISIVYFFHILRLLFIRKIIIYYSPEENMPLVNPIIDIESKPFDLYNLELDRFLHVLNIIFYITLLVGFIAYVIRGSRGGTTAFGLSWSLSVAGCAFLCSSIAGIVMRILIGVIKRKKEQWIALPY